jgi:hypothetical protein
VELRPPPAVAAGDGSVDAWIDLGRSVRSLLADGRFVLFTDDAVGSREEESLQHLTANLGANADLSGVVPFLTLKHTLEYCLLFARRVASHGLGGLTITGGDQETGHPRCLPRSRDLRRLVREQVPGLPLGAWVNPHREPERQVDLLLEPGHAADYYLTQVVSHYDMAALERFLKEAGRRGLALPGLVGVFYYRSGNVETLRRLEEFIPVPTVPLVADLRAGVTPESVCARTLRALESRGVEHVYLSNLNVRGAFERLKGIEALVEPGATPAGG